MDQVAIKSSDVLKYVRVNVRITGAMFGWHNWRLHLATALIKLAGLILTVEVVVSSEG